MDARLLPPGRPRRGAGGGGLRVARIELPADYMLG